MNKEKKPTPEYVKRACTEYQRKKDRVNLLLNPGTKDAIKAVYGREISLNAYINKLIAKDLKRANTGVNAGINNPFSDLQK